MKSYSWYNPLLGYFVGFNEPTLESLVAKVAKRINEFDDVTLKHEEEYSPMNLVKTGVFIENSEDGNSYFAEGNVITNEGYEFKLIKTHDNTHDYVDKLAVLEKEILILQQENKELREKNTQLRNQIIEESNSFITSYKELEAENKELSLKLHRVDKKHPFNCRD